jgi:pyridoxal 5'-phosphate synthase pdxS subunit
LLGNEERVREAKELGAPLELVTSVAKAGRLPVPNFAAGGIATPADAALCMALGAEAVFVGSGIFLSENPAKRARAIVTAVTCWEDAAKLAEVSTGLGRSMRSVEVSSLAPTNRFAGRGA